MTINLAALKTELTTDPAALGYAAFLPMSDAKPLLAIINAVPPLATANLGVQDVSARDLINAIDPSEIQSFSASQSQMISWIVAAGGLSVDSFTQANAIFPAGNSRTAFMKLLKRKPTRAEQLFGRDTIVTVFDLSAALAL
jgi:hypothetical protein